MRKYFTWRCIKLHLVVLVLVPGFLVAGWWQYNVARGGNDLSWVYTVEWPLFAVYAVYMWWKLIHDKSTLFDRMWWAKQRIAAEASGTPIHEIPGWAMDKELSRVVHEASADTSRVRALAPTPTQALESQEQKGVGAAERDLEPDEAGRDGREVAASSANAVIDARVVGVKVVVDEELDAYNRYLFELSRSDPPKRWTSSPRRSRPDGAVTRSEPPHPESKDPPEASPPGLPSGDTVR